MNNFKTFLTESVFHDQLLSYWQKGMKKIEKHMEEYGVDVNDYMTPPNSVLDVLKKYSKQDDIDPKGIFRPVIIRYWLFRMFDDIYDIPDYLTHPKVFDEKTNTFKPGGFEKFLEIAARQTFQRPSADTLGLFAPAYYKIKYSKDYDKNILDDHDLNKIISFNPLENDMEDVELIATNMRNKLHAILDTTTHRDTSNQDLVASNDKFNIYKISNFEQAEDMCWRNKEGGTRFCVLGPDRSHVKRYGGFPFYVITQKGEGREKLFSVFMPRNSGLDNMIRDAGNTRMLELSKIKELFPLLRTAVEDEDEIYGLEKFVNSHMSESTNFKTYFQLLTEMFKIQPYEQKGGYFFFNSGGHKFAASADQTVWNATLAFQVDFGVVKDNGIIDYKTTLSQIGEAVDATDVVSTVVDIAMNVVKQSDEYEVWFVFAPSKGESEEIGVHTKRTSLYSRIVRRIAPNYGYILQKVEQIGKDDVGFLLVKE